MGNREQREVIYLQSCRMGEEIIIGRPTYNARDDLTTIESHWRVPGWIFIRPYMKIRGVLFRDTERDDREWNVIPLQIWFRYYKDRIGTKYLRSNQPYASSKNPEAEPVKK